MTPKNLSFAPSLHYLVATSLLALTIVEPEIGSDHRETSNIDNILVFPFRSLSMFCSQTETELDP